MLVTKNKDLNKFTTLVDAAVALNKLQTVIKELGRATFADWKQICGEKFKHEDTLVGWTDILSSHIQFNYHSFDVYLPPMKILEVAE